MSTLVLVRHGQASFLENDYDKLSPLGEEQARRLGEHLAREGAVATEIFVGPRRRHAQTLSACLEAFRAVGGGALPEPRLVPELDEHGADHLVKAHLVRLSEEHPELGPLVAQAAEAADRKARWKATSRLLDAVFRLWVEGRAHADDVEPFVSFRKRVSVALGLMREGEPSGRLGWAFTSGGFIGAAVAEVVRADDRAAYDLGIMSHNASFTEIVWSAGRQSLGSFNARPHLTEARLVTLR